MLSVNIGELKENVEEVASENVIVQIEESGCFAEATNDAYSDRLRIDHPPRNMDADCLSESLVDAAENAGRSRIVALVDSSFVPAFVSHGYELEGVMPGFYEGERDCAVLGFGLEEYRMEPGAIEDINLVNQVLNRPFELQDLNEDPSVASEVATVEDAVDIAELLGQTFSQYPTPSSDPEYVASQIEDGTIFRVVREHEHIVACASADLVREALTAELTDCATRPECRGQGYMQAVLHALIQDLQDMNYPTAFTLARAGIPGVNRAFQKLGFRRRGLMARSCRIGEGLEDMNIWSRAI